MTSETHFVFRVGPVPVKDGEVFAYFVDPGREGARTFLAEADQVGLDQVGRAYAGVALECEPELESAAAVFGMRRGDLTDERKHIIGIVAFDMVFGDLLKGIERAGVVYQFGLAASAFWRAAPWRGIDRALEVDCRGSAPGRFECVVMSGDLKFGLSLYSGPGTAERLITLARAGRLDEAARADSLLVTFDDHPAYAVDAMRRAYELPRLPVPMRMVGGRGVWLTDVDLLRLAGALKAVSILSGEIPIATSQVTVDDLSIEVVARVMARVSEG